MSFAQLAKAAHELAHALGLLHVHSRYDRDKYVVINVKNIPANLLKNDFALETKAATDNYDVPYDYGSRMHYPASAFALDKSMPTIIPVDKNYVETMGSPFVSFYDILLMNKHYGCLGESKIPDAFSHAFIKCACVSFKYAPTSYSD
ncbi:unnamed protein product [Cylicostephanus goldi]|uniref:Metalloendopeptidase n=1 Tax=Cylicostephanus goldi TaxID=71465 RepID=A0A3P6SRB2_CYLGO|nr:unnamed protein product [Cylicostephanus goldi]